jgi:hypothetical protein
MEGYRAEMRGLKLGEERNRVVLKMDSAASVSMSGKKGRIYNETEIGNVLIKGFNGSRSQPSSRGVNEDGHME